MRVTESAPDLVAPCAFVPTMGALHAGHESLIKIARQYSEEVVVSVFVNPLQFEDKSDLTNYPKTPEQDEELARRAGAKILWRPEISSIYPGDEVRLSAGELGRRFEGLHRTGHFDGVLTVVNRLFELVRPKYAIFGEKDFQQLFLIRRMAKELHPSIEIIAAPTIREKSGLALSSRNVRLSEQGKNLAREMFATLQSAARVDSLEGKRESLAKLASVAGFELDYAEIIDEENFEIADGGTQKARAIVAGWVEGVRLIDNLQMQDVLVRA